VSGLLRGDVSRHVRREESDKLGGRPSRKHGRARVVRRRDQDTIRDHDRQRIDARRRENERTRRALTDLTAANDRIRCARAKSDDRYENGSCEEHRKETHVLLEEQVAYRVGQPIDSAVLSPRGWKSLSSMAIGDEVIASTGQYARVVSISEPFVAPIVRMEFSDGASAYSAVEQLWSVQSSDRRSRGQPPRFLCSRAIAARTHDSHGAARHFVGQPAPIDMPEQSLPIPPYLLGALLGDGGISKKQAYFATGDHEMIERLMPLLPQGVYLKRRADYWWSMSAESRGKRNPLLAQLRDLKLLGHRAETKFVPKMYLLGSRSQRLELLRALLDTDGSADRAKPPSYTSVSMRLACDVRELVRSLGGVAVLAYRKGTVLPQYCLSMRFPSEVQPFALSRKAAIYEQKIQRPWRLARTVLRVTEAGTAECRSIVLGGADHAYVAQDYVLISDGTALRCERSKFSRSTVQACGHVIR
jgi:hypothetical protein